MPDSIETVVKTDVSSEITSLKSRISALESEASGYVKAHMLYFAVAISLIVGAVFGHILK